MQCIGQTIKRYKVLLPYTQLRHATQWKTTQLTQTSEVSKCQIISQPIRQVPVAMIQQCSKRRPLELDRFYMQQRRRYFAALINSVVGDTLLQTGPATASSAMSVRCPST